MNDGGGKTSIYTYKNRPPLVPIDNSPKGKKEAIRVSQARSSLFLDIPFIGFIVGNLEIIPTKSLMVTSFGNDLKYLYINPNFTSLLTKEEIKGELVHQCIHMISVVENIDVKKPKYLWYIAMEIESINFLIKLERLLIQSYSLFGRYPDKRKNVWGKKYVLEIPSVIFGESLSNIFNYLIKFANAEFLDFSDRNRFKIMIKKHGLSPLCSFGSIWEFYNHINSNEILRLDLIRIKGIFQYAISQLRGPRKIPKELLDKIIQPIEDIMDWQSVLFEELTHNILGEWSWVRVNRKFVGEGLILPTMYGEQSLLIVLINEESTFIEDGIENFASDIVERLLHFPDIHLILILYSSYTSKFYDFYSGDQADVSYSNQSPLSLDFGFSKSYNTLNSIFRWINKTNLEPKYLVCFSSRIYFDQDFIPSYELIWVTDSNVEVDFGRKISILPSKEREYMKYYEENQNKYDNYYQMARKEESKESFLSRVKRFFKKFLL